MKIAMAADHGGFELKNAIKAHLEAKGYEVLDLGVNIHSCPAAFMSGQILNGFGVNTDVDQIRDISVPQLMRRDQEIHRIGDVRIALRMTAQPRMNRIPDSNPQSPS